MDLFTIKEMVRDTLAVFPETREDDDTLILYIYHDFYGIREETFREVMKNRKERKLPSFESIRRARRKAQEEYPALRATEQAEQARFAMQEGYINLALGGE